MKKTKGDEDYITLTPDEVNSFVNGADLVINNTKTKEKYKFYNSGNGTANIDEDLNGTVVYFTMVSSLNGYEMAIVEDLGDRGKIVGFMTFNSAPIITTDSIDSNYLENRLDKIENKAYIGRINGVPIISPIESPKFNLQSTLYRHTITIYEGNTQDGNSVCFTAYTPSNTPIDSIQDLTASADGSNKLANTDLACFGVSGTAEALVLYNGIHIGTDLASTTFRKAVGGSVAFSSAFATYTITDDVTLN